MPSFTSGYIQKSPGECRRISALFREIIDWIEIKDARFDDVIQAANENYFDALCLQSTPYSVNNHTIVVFCGLAISETSFAKGLSFFQGRSKSANFIAQMLDHIIAWEYGDPKHHCQKLQTLFTLNNLYNWAPALGRDVWVASVSCYVFAFRFYWQLYLAQEFLRRWLELTQPLVVITFGHLSSGVVSSSFHGRSRLGNNGSPVRSLHCRALTYNTQRLSKTCRSCSTCSLS